MRRACATILDRAAGVPYLDYVKHVNHEAVLGQLVALGYDRTKITAHPITDEDRALRRLRYTILVQAPPKPFDILVDIGSDDA